MPSKFKLIVVTGAAALGLAFQPSAGLAATWFVGPGGSDSNDCAAASSACATINAAITKPTFAPGDTVKVGTGTYTAPDFAPQGEIVRISTGATLLGGWNADFTARTGSSVIDAIGHSTRRGVTVDPGVTATLDGFVIQNGLAPSPGGGGIRNDGDLTVSNTTIRASSSGGGIVGGGILNVGTLRLQQSVVTENMAAEGAGIANGGTLLVTQSEIRSNTSGSGGGLQNYTFATATLLASTIAENTSRTRGAGIFDEGTVVLTNSTISGNQASPPWDGGGLYLAGSTPQAYLNNTTVTNNSAGRAGGINGGVLRNSIIAGNTATEFAPDCDSNTFVPLVSSAGNNLVGNTSNCFFTPTSGDLLNLAPLLGPLADNGGPTRTHALLDGSPAIDAGNASGCTDQTGAPILTDQRGVSRPVDTCDIGAFEVGELGDHTPPAITVPTDITVDATTPNGAVVNYTVTVQDDQDPTPTLSCVPSSGSTFPIGTTTVTCTATDASDNSATASFTVRVKGAAEQLGDLRDAVTRVGPGTSLADKLDKVLAQLIAGDREEACGTLTAFVNQLHALSGHTISTATANELIESAERIEAVLAC